MSVRGLVRDYYCREAGRYSTGAVAQSCFFFNISIHWQQVEGLRLAWDFEPQSSVPSDIQTPTKPHLQILLKLFSQLGSSHSNLGACVCHYYAKPPLPPTTQMSLPPIFSCVCKPRGLCILSKLLPLSSAPTHPYYFEAGTGGGGAVKWECGFPHHKGGGQKPTYRSLFSPTKWNRRTDLRLSDLATDILSADPSHQPTESIFF